MAAEAPSLLLPPAQASPGEARAFTLQRLRDWGLDALADVTALLVSELVTNAVRHAGTRLEVSLARRADRLWVCVHDEDPADLPVRRNPDPDAERGRGLLLVDALADRWGCDRCHDGKNVWFELTR